MIQKLRTSMLEQKLDMLIVVSADEHLNEYLPAQNWRVRASTSYGSSQGFTGSAGTAVFCVEGRSQLFVDSRYHLQAEQTCSDHFDIHKLGNEGVLEPQKWLASQSQETLTIGADANILGGLTATSIQVPDASNPLAEIKVANRFSELKLLYLILLLLFMMSLWVVNKSKMIKQCELD